MRDNAFALAALLGLSSAVWAQGKPQDCAGEALASCFEDAAMPAAKYAWLSYGGELRCGQGEPESVLLFGPRSADNPLGLGESGRAIRLPAEDALRPVSRSLFWKNKKEETFELRQWDEEHVILKVVQQGETCYGAFAAVKGKSVGAGRSSRSQAPESPTLAALRENVEDPFALRRKKDGLRDTDPVLLGGKYNLTGEATGGYHSGSFPVYTRGTTIGSGGKHSKGPSAAAKLEFKWLSEPDNESWTKYVKALGFELSNAYTASKEYLLSGRNDLGTKLTVWPLQKYIALEAGYERSDSVNRPSSDQPFKNKGGAQEDAWIGALWTPFGPFADRGFEAFFNTRKLPLGADDERVILVTNRNTNNLGQGPDLGFLGGIRFRYLFCEKCEVPVLGIKLKDLKLLGELALGGGTVIDSPDVARLLAEASVKFTDYIGLKLGHRAQYDISRNVRDPHHGQAAVNEYYLQAFFEHNFLGGR